MQIRKVGTAMSGMTWTVAIFAAILLVGFSTPLADAHHSYAMYDATIYRVFTGVMVRVVPNAVHFEMHFVPLNEERDALVRGEDDEPEVWVVQMESGRTGTTGRHYAGKLPHRGRFSAWAYIRSGTAIAAETVANRVCSDVRWGASPRRASIATRLRAARPSGTARFLKTGVSPSCSRVFVAKSRRRRQSKARARA